MNCYEPARLWPRPDDVIDRNAADARFAKGPGLQAIVAPISTPFLKMTRSFRNRLFKKPNCATVPTDDVVVRCNVATLLNCGHLPLPWMACKEPTLDGCLLHSRPNRRASYTHTHAGADPSRVERSDACATTRSCERNARRGSRVLPCRPAHLNRRRRVSRAVHETALSSIRSACCLAHPNALHQAVVLHICFATVGVGRRRHVRRIRPQATGDIHAIPALAAPRAVPLHARGELQVEQGEPGEQQRSGGPKSTPSSVCSQPESS